MGAITMSLTSNRSVLAEGVDTHMAMGCACLVDSPRQPSLGFMTAERH